MPARVAATAKPGYGTSPSTIMYLATMNVALIVGGIFTRVTSRPMSGGGDGTGVLVGTAVAVAGGAGVAVAVGTSVAVGDAVGVSDG